MIRNHRPARHRNRVTSRKHGKRHSGDLTQDLRNIGQHIQGAARENYEQLKDRASEYYDEGMDKARAWEDELLSYVREKPIQSMLISAGLGMLLGRYWGRR